MPADERVLLLRFQLKLHQSEGGLNVFFPIGIAAAMLRKLSTMSITPSRAGAPTAGQKIQECGMDCACTMELSVRGIKVAVQDVLSLQPGKLLDLGIPISAPAVVSLEGFEWFEASPVRAGSSVRRNWPTRSRSASVPDNEEWIKLYDHHNCHRNRRTDQHCRKAWGDALSRVAGTPCEVHASPDNALPQSMAICISVQAEGALSGQAAFVLDERNATLLAHKLAGNSGNGVQSGQELVRQTIVFAFNEFQKQFGSTRIQVSARDQSKLAAADFSGVDHGYRPGGLAHLSALHLTANNVSAKLDRPCSCTHGPAQHAPGHGCRTRSHAALWTKKTPATSTGGTEPRLHRRTR